MKHYLVIGAGVTGCAAALELAQQGYRVSILESSEQIGGKSRYYCCKATDSCSRCGVCVAHEKISEALRHPGITFKLGSCLEKVEKNGGSIFVSGFYLNPSIMFADCIDCRACAEECPQKCISRYSRGGLSFYWIAYEACSIHQGRECTSCVRACPVDAIRAQKERSPFTEKVEGVIVATGHETFDPRVKPRLGYGRFPGVMTGLEAEQALSVRAVLERPDLEDHAGKKHAGMGPAKDVAFVQCVGSRDPSLGRNFCSGVCCAYALRIARMLKSRQPETAVTVYYIDIQNFDKVFTPFRAELDRLGIRFIRGIPSSVTRTSAGMLELLVEDPNGRQTTARHDLVVLSTGLRPAEGSARLAGLFGLQDAGFGFFSSREPRVKVAGTCREPAGIIDSIASARAAAVEMMT